MGMEEYYSVQETRMETQGTRETFQSLLIHSFAFL